MLHVALVSTYPPLECGIATYTGALFDQMRRRPGVDARVIAERCPGDAEIDDPRVSPCWRRDRDWVGDIVAAIDADPPDVVHIQHVDSIFGQNRRFLDLLGALRARRIATVVTLHNVYGRGVGWGGLRWAPQRFQRRLSELADRVVVHQQRGCQDRLLEQGADADKVKVIPHGTAPVPAIDRAEARAAIGCPPGAKLVAFLGFIHFRKGLHTLLSAFPRVVDAVPEARLLVAGRLRRSPPHDTIYNAILPLRMKAGRRDGWLDYRPGFQPEPELLASLFAADVLALPYRQSYGSASGILHMACATGTAFICAQGPKFMEAHQASSLDPELPCPEPGDRAAWSEALIALLTDDDLRARAQGLARRLGGETSWDVVASAHLRAYHQAMAAAAAAAPA